jgi:hypothetical protein
MLTSELNETSKLLHNSAKKPKSEVAAPSADPEVDFCFEQTNRLSEASKHVKLHVFGLPRQAGAPGHSPSAEPTGLVRKSQQPHSIWTQVVAAIPREVASASDRPFFEQTDTDIVGEDSPSPAPVESAPE